MNSSRPSTFAVSALLLAGTVLAACAPRPAPDPPMPLPPPVPAVSPADTAEMPEVPRQERVEPTERLQVEARWRERTPLPRPRTEVSVATDGERIYLAGGFGPPEGEERASAPRTLWAYSPTDDNWSSIGTIPEGVHHAAFVHHRNRLYILGGFRETSFEPVPNVRIYDLATGRWSEGAPMPTPRGAAGFTVLEGRIHVIGGNATSDHQHDHGGVLMTEDRSVNTHEAYDPETDSWTTLEPMPTPRNHLGAAAVNGRIHAVVGRADGNFTMTTHEVYDLATDSWRQAPPVPTGRSGVAVVEHGGYVYVFGGETFGENQRTFRDAERFDSRTNRWETLPAMPTARHGLGAAPYGGGIFVISGGPRPGFSFGGANEYLELGR
jgi:N-acetylneuraminic acid mutarotase